MTEPVPYLSGRWLELASDALAGVAPLPEPVVVGYRVTGGPSTGDGDGERRHHLRLGPDRVAMGPGLGDADLTLTLDWDLAVAIHRGRAGAQRAVLDGRIRLAGDPDVLLGHQAALATIDDRLAGLRDRTSYPTPD